MKAYFVIPAKLRKEGVDLACPELLRQEALSGLTALETTEVILLET